MTIDLQSLNQTQVVNFYQSGDLRPDFLTPDSLLAYCETRLRHLDEDVKKQFTSQQSNIADQQKIDDFLRGVKQAFSAQANGGKAGMKAIGDNIDKAVVDGLDKIQDPATRAAAQKAWGAMQDAYNKDQKDITIDDLQRGFLQGFDDAKGALSKNSELGMIQLQSIMSQRQSAVQITTNLVQSLGEQMKSITGNIGK